MKFNQLNGILHSMLTATIDSPQHKKVLRMKDNWEDDSLLSAIYRSYKTYENFIKLKRIKQIHLELIKCAQNINEAYGLQIFMSMSSSVVFITLLAYNLYAILIAKYYDDWVKEIYAHLYWIFYFTFKILAINNICHATTMEAMNTGDILCELYEPSTNKKFRDKIRDFKFQLIQNRLTFNACGFYNLDHTFIYSAIGSITTYLVILIQVGDNPKIFYNNINNSSTPKIKMPPKKSNFHNARSREARRKRVERANQSGEKSTARIVAQRIRTAKSRAQESQER
ncbi:PREDICTED: gustatory receptor for sugar taste 43a-like [Polistes canadensis]|uniref:gustatory receptor for sugar taste 43a-like n=1 Tax=Polistes canadensis TaxID=91411 RepID=UPI000718BFA7|nr:PREDICTED: gustatory receptor for sugar taste 43a-like [Polistes canadensis]